MTMISLVRSGGKSFTQAVTEISIYEFTSLRLTVNSLKLIPPNIIITQIVRVLPFVYVKMNQNSVVKFCVESLNEDCIGNIQMITISKQESPELHLGCIAYILCLCSPTLLILTFHLVLSFCRLLAGPIFFHTRTRDNLLVRWINSPPKGDSHLFPQKNILFKTHVLGTSKSLRNGCNRNFHCLRANSIQKIMNQSPVCYSYLSVSARKKPENPNSFCFLSIHFTHCII